MAYTEATGVTGYYTVTAVWAHEDPAVTYVAVNGEVIEATPEHPFYTPLHGWVSAGELWPGVLVRDAAGEYAPVQWVQSVAQTQPMWDLTVDVAHTFFVGDGQWLVHNQCPVTIGGEFSIIDWTDYPNHPGVPKPKGPFRIIEGQEYQDALRMKNNANAAIHRSNPQYAGQPIHEVHPVKWGGSPTDPANKVVLPPEIHEQFTSWWAHMMARLKNGG